MSLFILTENTNFEHIIGVLFNNWTALKVSISPCTYCYWYVIVYLPFHSSWPLNMAWEDRLK